MTITTTEKSFRTGLAKDTVDLDSLKTVDMARQRIEIRRGKKLFGVRDRKE